MSPRLNHVLQDMEDLVRICKVCKCESLQRILEKELIHQKYAEYKALRDVDNSQKRFILQGSSLPEEDRLPTALHHILHTSLAKSTLEWNLDGSVDSLIYSTGAIQMSDSDDLADVCVRVDKKIFRLQISLRIDLSNQFQTFS